MAEKLPQSYENHRRLDPSYHYGATLIALALFVSAVVGVIRRPGFDRGWEVLLSIGLFFLVLKVRGYALHNQDRLIRLEETLRMQRVLPEALRARIQELDAKQMVALRFASDLELTALVEQTLAESLKPEAIKKLIKTWRPDTFRV